MNPDPSHYLPHRYPFQMLDRIISVEHGVSATAVTLVSRFGPVFPQMLMLECIAQLAGVAVGTEGEGGFLAAVERAEFSGLAAAGDSLDICVSVVKSFGRLHLLEGRVESAGSPLLTASLTLGTGML